MWRENKVWRHYPDDIIASDGQSARVLASYIKRVRQNSSYISYLEVVDLQKYKVIKQVAKVRAAIRERKYIPFVFVVGKN